MRATDLEDFICRANLTDIEVMVEIDSGSGRWLIPATYLRTENGAIIISTFSADSETFDYLD